MKHFVALIAAAFVAIAAADLVAQPPEQVHLALGAPGVMVVSWVTQDSTVQSVIQYGSSEEDLSSSVFARNFKFTDGGSTRRNITIHNGEIKGLAAGQRYYYRVGCADQGWSEIFSFKMLPDGKPVVDIAVFGDFGVVNSRSLTLLQDEAYRGTIDMVIHAGDFAYNMDDEEGVRGDKFMRQIESIAAHMPYQVCAGNHESAYNFSHYTNRFSAISENTPSGNNWFFSFDVSWVHFVAFNTEVYYHDELADIMAAQYAWLQKDLEAARANKKETPFIVLYGHRPVVCSNVDDIPDCTLDAMVLRDGVDGQYGIDRLMHDYGVDLYLTAHEHSYERTYPTFNGTFDAAAASVIPGAYVNAKYPVHIVTGSAGCQEDLDYYDEVFYGPWSAFRSASYGYGHLRIVNATHLHWRQLLDEGNGGSDEIWIIKDASLGRPAEQHEPEGFSNGCDHYCVATCLSAHEGDFGKCAAMCRCEGVEESVVRRRAATVRRETTRVGKRHV